MLFYPTQLGISRDTFLRRKCPPEVISGLSHPSKKKYFRKIQIFSEIANSDMVESASHPHPHTYGGAPSRMCEALEMYAKMSDLVKGKLSKFAIL